MSVGVSKHNKASVHFRNNEEAYQTPFGEDIAAANTFSFSNNFATSDKLAFGVSGTVNLDADSYTFRRRLTSSVFSLEYKPDCWNIRLALTENVVAESVNLMTRAYELGIQAKNDTLTAVDRLAISFEIGQIRESMMGLANSKDTNGDYLFAGYSSNTQPFVSNDAGEVQFAGDRGVHSVQVSESLRANTGLDGADLFMRVESDGAVKPFFDILTSLERELQDGVMNDDRVSELNACIDHFAINQTRVGAEMNKLDYQRAAMERRVVLMDENLSGMEDADLAELVTELQGMIVSRDAAQRTFVQIGQQSLFDYIR